jgi:hypothetical protein
MCALWLDAQPNPAVWSASYLLPSDSGSNESMFKAMAPNQHDLQVSGSGDAFPFCAADHHYKADVDLQYFRQRPTSSARNSKTFEHQQQFGVIERIWRRSILVVLQHYLND